jgi:hypothetical protein
MGYLIYPNVPWENNQAEHDLCMANVGFAHNPSQSSE